MYFVFLSNNTVFGFLYDNYIFFKEKYSPKVLTVTQKNIAMNTNIAFAII